MNNGDNFMEKGLMDKAAGEYRQAEKILPENQEVKYWHAIALANNEDIDSAVKILKNVYKKDKNWRLLTKRLPQAGLLNVSKEDLNRLIELK
jgi:tetratricopeptide (TPR) repeat protein